MNTVLVTVFDNAVFSAMSQLGTKERSATSKRKGKQLKSVKNFIARTQAKVDAKLTQSRLLPTLSLPYDWLLTMVRSTRKHKTTQGVFLTWKIPCSVCRYKTKMDKRSGFWQVDLIPPAQELLALITPKARVFT